MKQAIFVFVITTIIYVSCVIWITQGLKLEPMGKIDICFIGLIFIVAPTLIIYIEKKNK